MKKRSLAVLASFLVVGSVIAAKPAQLSVTPGLALHNRTVVIEGVSLNLWGQNPQTGLALGFVNGSSGRSGGLSVGFLNYGEAYTGCQWGLVNTVAHDYVGWQGGFLLGLVGSVVNDVGGTLTGFQCGVVNYTGKLNGLQLGIFNYARTVHAGVQVGVVNIMPENAWFSAFPSELAPGMILLNWHF